MRIMLLVLYSCPLMLACKVNVFVSAGFLQQQTNPSYHITSMLPLSIIIKIHHFVKSWRLHSSHRKIESCNHEISIVTYAWQDGLVEGIQCTASNVWSRTPHPPTIFHISAILRVLYANVIQDCICRS